MCKTGILAGSFLAFESGMFGEKKARFSGSLIMIDGAIQVHCLCPTVKEPRGWDQVLCSCMLLITRAVRILENPILTLPVKLLNALSNAFIKQTSIQP